MTDRSTAPGAADYTRLYEREHPRLVAYARTLTADSWAAEDLVAEAHFRVWRRLRDGHDIDNVSAYLTTTVKNLATTVGRATREIPQDPVDGPAWPDVPATAGADPFQRVAYVELLAKVLGQLPRRWVTALWLAEAEGQPLETVGRRIGAGRGATAVLLHRAREGMRQAFLRTLPGTPERAACGKHWERMPACVRGVAPARQSDGLDAHVADCPDCRARLALLTRANHRLPALVGPALLVLFAGGAGKFLLPVAGAAGAAGAAQGGSGGSGSGALKSVGQLLRGGTGQAGPVAAGVTGVGVLAVAGAVAAGIALAAGTGSGPRQEAAAPGVTAPARTGSPGPAGSPEATGPEGAAPAGPTEGPASSAPGATGRQTPGVPAPSATAAPRTVAPTAPPVVRPPGPSPTATSAPTSAPTAAAPTRPPTPAPTPTVVPSTTPPPIPSPTRAPNPSPSPTRHCLEWGAGRWTICWYG
ncbi:sigma factor [Streptomyces syringium]|uniref:RNA polymerase sigma factor (Sigma-70 family) n=1 Tax=Streptomyces syringium TaxID=76729 RepID=A0ABS4YC51_9ACTN|nr:sigma factor [Streptomyces syringium]MBP2406085.1 RNA polymerase sigma factor (sigma-70 family) [Streptomyces syringium]